MNVLAIIDLYLGLRRRPVLPCLIILFIDDDDGQEQSQLYEEVAENSDAGVYAEPLHGRNDSNRTQQKSKKVRH